MEKQKPTKTLQIFSRIKASGEGKSFPNFKNAVGVGMNEKVLASSQPEGSRRQ